MCFLCHSLTIGTKKWNELSPSEDVPFWSSCWQLPRPPWHHFLIVWQLSEMSGIFLTLESMGRAWCSNQWITHFSFHRNHLEGLWKHRLLGPTPRVSDSSGPEGGPRIYISNKSLGDVDVISQGIHFENHFPPQPLWLIQGPQPVCLWPSGHTDWLFQPLAHYLSRSSYSEAQGFGLIRKSILSNVVCGY